MAYLTSESGLFGDFAIDDPATIFPRASRPIATRDCTSATCADRFSISTLQEIVDIFAAARNMRDPYELLRLFIGRIERAGPAIGGFDELAESWSNAHALRGISEAEVFASPATAPFLKAVFDFYFRTDLYGHWKESDPIILSSGSFDGTIYGLPSSLKDCLRFALDRNWYGYSHSFGRTSARQALAEFESVRLGSAPAVSPEEIVVTLGGTSAVASVADFLALQSPNDTRVALCAVPNYPPLLASIAKRFRVELVPTPIHERQTDIAPLIAAVATQRPRLILLQTVTNPSGLRVAEEQIGELVRAVPSDCYVILDECHNYFGPLVELTPERRRPNVITIHSLSKLWASPGLKVGWMTASPDFADEFYEHASTMYGGPPSIAFLLLEIFAMFEAARLRGGLDVSAALRRLSPDYNLKHETLAAGYADYMHSFDVLHDRVYAARSRAADALADAGFEVLVPDYSINMLARFGDLPSYHLYRELVSKAGVSVYPGLLCAAGSPGLVRISPCVPEPVLLEAVRRIKRWSYSS
jgi:aspartate/methionine/tyrosine aminotransferase